MYTAANHLDSNLQMTVSCLICILVLVLLCASISFAACDVASAKAGGNFTAAIGINFASALVCCVLFSALAFTMQQLDKMLIGSVLTQYQQHPVPLPDSVVPTVIFGFAGIYPYFLILFAALTKKPPLAFAAGFTRNVTLVTGALLLLALCALTLEIASQHRAELASYENHLRMGDGPYYAQLAGKIWSEH